MGDGDKKAQIMGHTEIIGKSFNRRIQGLINRTAEYPPAMLVLSRAIITVELIDYRGATSDPIKGVAGRSNKASGS